MSERRAFTLVELLVVIGIITLLVGILVPSLNVVKDLSRVAKCATNISAALRDVLMYVNASDGLLPPYRYTSSPTPTVPETPWHTTMAFSNEGNPVNDPDTGLLNDARNLGFVYKREYIHDYRVLYCPRQPKVEHTLEPYPSPWGMGPNPILMGYMFNPNVEEVDGQVRYMFSPLVDIFPSDRPLICDLVWGADVTSHTVGNEWRWNLGQLNGNVSTAMSRQAQEYLVNNPSSPLGQQWGQFRATVYGWVLMQ
ncbi:MAG: type II secretion system GspH family protein [Phycisphaerae bacterium]|nr:type II secretion system GspH family protein [Phycisphaerae bacterium]